MCHSMRRAPRVLRGLVSRTALRACHARRRLLRRLNSTPRSGQNGQAQPSGRQQRQRERSPSSENRRLKASSIATPTAKLFASSQVVSAVREATLPAQKVTRGSAHCARPRFRYAASERARGAALLGQRRGPPLVLTVAPAFPAVRSNELRKHCH